MIGVAIQPNAMREISRQLMQYPPFIMPIPIMAPMVA